MKVQRELEQTQRNQASKQREAMDFVINILRAVKDGLENKPNNLLQNLGINLTAA